LEDVPHRQDRKASSEAEARYGCALTLGPKPLTDAQETLMDRRPWMKLRIVLASVFLAAISTAVYADAYINEIFFDPPGGPGDASQEFIELRGTPGMSLNNHYLILLESENTAPDTGNSGQIDFIVDLSGRSFSPTGFFSLRQRGPQGGANEYTNVPNDAFNVVNTAPPINPGNPSEGGWGRTPGVDNNIGVSTSTFYSSDPGKIENSGFTAMLICVNSGGAVPILGQNLDGGVDNDGDSSSIDKDGLDYPNGVPDLSPNNPAWTIVDAVGVFSEGTGGTTLGEAVYGRTYATINFGPEIPGQNYSYFDPGQGEIVSFTFQPNIRPDQKYVGVGYEVEQIARWGNSTGQTAPDWHITNVTNNALSGFTSVAGGFRQSGHYHDNPNDDFVETNQYVPYGANMTDTIGSANYPANLLQLPWDYNKNGTTDAADYVLWRKTFGSTTDLSADGNNGKKVEEDDHRFWRGRFGDTVGGFGSGTSLQSGTTIVPEPASLTLLLLLVFGGLLAWRRS
jgi:hypothetical protein